MKKIIFILSFFVLAIALQAQEFQVGDLYYKVTSNSTPYTAEVSKLSKKSRLTTLDIPEMVDYKGTTYTVTSLREKAFRKSQYLTSVSIPNTVESMGDYCFEASGHLQIVTLPSSLLDISAGAFKGCTSLSTINIPSSVNSIGYMAFYNCTSLTTIDIPSSVNSIGFSTFSGCTSLSTINIPSSVNSIGFGAFSDCTSLSTIYIPNNLTDLQLFTFSRCTSLKSIIIPNSVTKIGWGVFSGCKFLKKIIYQGTSQQWQQITKHEKWREGSNFTIAYAPVSDKVQSVQQPLLAQEKPQVPVVEKTTTTITPIPQPTTPLEMMSAVDKNIPQTHIRNENTFVVIIANENYEQVASVPYAINDGQVFQQYCERTLGIPHQNIKTYIDATYNHIRAAQSWLQKICEVFEDEQIIFYYAGHGIPDESSRTAYLLPVDGIGTDISTGYKLDDLYSALGNIPTKNVIVFMDACFSGSKREEGMLASARGVAIKARSGMPKGNMVVFSAAQGDETAYPNNEERHGMFTYFLLKKLQDTKGDVTLQELGEYITKNVSQQSILLNGKSQTPCVTPSASLDASWREWKLK